MKGLQKIFLYFLAFLLPFNAWGWSAMGHAVIAQIAYQHLTPAAKRQINALTKVMFDSRYSIDRFVESSVWPDEIKFRDITAFDEWHFINTPYVLDGVRPLPVNKENVVWAIIKSEQVVASTKPLDNQKIWFFNFLVHFVGDAHQPLHCIALYNKTFNKGDAAGNAIIIISPIAENFHQFWDFAGGLFPHGEELNYLVIERYRDQIMQKFPESYFGNAVNDLNPADWAQQSYELAKQAYQGVQPNQPLSPEYIAHAQLVSEKQIALAAYRLANLLNKIYGN